MAIIAPTLFDAAQKRLQRNKELAQRNRKNEYLLSGFFRCGTCNKSMLGHISGYGKWWYQRYRCAAHWHPDERRKCPNEKLSVLARSVEDKVWEWFADLVSDDEKLERGLQKLEDNESDEVGYRLGRLDTIKAMMDKTDQKIKRLMSNFGDEDDETIAGALQERLRRLQSSAMPCGPNVNPWKARFHPSPLHPKRGNNSDCW